MAEDDRTNSSSKLQKLTLQRCSKSITIKKTLRNNIEPACGSKDCSVIRRSFSEPLMLHISSSLSDEENSTLCVSIYGGYDASEILPFLVISSTGDGLIDDTDTLCRHNIHFMVDCCENWTNTLNISTNSSSGVHGKRSSGSGSGRRRRRYNHLSPSQGFQVTCLNLKDESSQSLEGVYDKYFSIVKRAKKGA